MSRRLLRLEIPVFPERMMFRVHDPVADLDAPGAPLPPVDSLISTSRDQLIVSCAQEHLGVQLTVEEWDDAPPPFSDGYEDEAKCVLYLRGRLSVDMGSAGRAVESLRLTGGVGDYGVRVYTRNRTAALQSYERAVPAVRRPAERRVPAGPQAAGGAGAVPAAAVARVLTSGLRHPGTWAPGPLGAARCQLG